MSVERYTVEDQPENQGASLRDRAVVNGAGQAVSALRASVPSASDQCTMGVGCDQYGVCYADAHGRPDQCPHYERDLEVNAWAWLDAIFTDVNGGRHANDRDYSADEMVDAFIAGHASAIEARSGATAGRDPKDESAVPQADAQNKAEDHP